MGGHWIAPNGGVIMKTVKNMLLPKIPLIWSVGGGGVTDF